MDLAARPMITRQPGSLSGKHAATWHGADLAILAFDLLVSGAAGHLECAHTIVVQIVAGIYASPSSARGPLAPLVV